MKIKMSIKTKMLLYILTTSVLIFIFSVGYISYKSRKLILEDAKKMVLSVTTENASKIEKSLSEDLAMLEAISEMFALIEGLEEHVWKQQFEELSIKILSKNDNLSTISASWEEAYYDSTLTVNETRYWINFVKKNGKIVGKKSIKDFSSGLYNRAKQINKTLLREPRYSEEDKINKVGLVSPIKKGNTYIGSVIINVSLSAFQKIAGNIKPFKSTRAYLISNKGKVVAHPNADYINTPFVDCAPHFEEQFEIKKIIKEGNAVVLNGIDSTGNNIMLISAPIQVGDYIAPWSLMLEVPEREVLYEANQVQIVSILVAIIGLILISIIIYYRTNKISSALFKTASVLEKLAQGDVENIEKLSIGREDEIDVMADSVNSLKESIDTKSDFAEQIGIGNLEAHYTALSSKDKLGNSLLDMQDNLKKARADEEKMKIEESRNKWVTYGLAKMSDIIRLNNDDMNTLSYNIMKNLIDYLDMSMGALFVAEIDNDEVYFESKAAVAFDRKKIINKKIYVGEGLIGRCAFEKKRIYMTDLPQEYISIRSGLGDANPGCLLLVPLMSEDKVQGVIELASLKPLEEYKIAFVEKLSEIIASTISSVQINQKTAELLQQSKQQSEELAAQEEEMRQNVEELQATQEEAARKEQELLGVIDLFNKTLFTVNYNTNKEILKINNKYCSFFNVSCDSLIGKTIQYESELLHLNKEEPYVNWDQLMKGNSHQRRIKVSIQNSEYIIEEQYHPIFDEDEKIPDEILKIGYIVS